MIRLGLRLTLSGGKEAVVRLVVTAAATALGVGLLLIALAGINAVNTQNGRYAWLETGYTPSSRSVTTSASAGATPTDPDWWVLTADEIDGKVIGRVDVAATGADSPVPPGIARLPRPGEFYASPALHRLLDSTPPAELRDRYPGREIGTIASAALPAPNSLIVVVGRTTEQLAHTPGAHEVTSIATTAPSSCDDCPVGVGIDANGLDLILAIAAGALIFPVLILIGTATRLAAARREQRFAAMRLVGATPRQVSVVSAVEATVAAIVGVAAGFVLFYALRPALAPIPFTGAPFFLGDLSLSLIDVIVVALGVPIAAAIAVRIALRRVQISPLGVSRRVTPRAPRAYRLIPLFAGVAELTAFVVFGHPKTTVGQLGGYLSGILIVMAGLVIAGPWLTMVGARVMARRTNRPSTLIAARRLADNPRAGFRAISGLVLALFVASVALAVIAPIVANRNTPDTGTTAKATIVDQFFAQAVGTGPPVTLVPPLPDSLVAKLHAIPGMRSVTQIHESAATTPTPGVVRHGLDGVVSCAQLARMPILGRCAPGASVASILDFVPQASQAKSIWPAADISPDRVAQLPVRLIVVGTNGATATIERVRTTLDLAYPYLGSPATISERANDNARTVAEWKQLADVAILTSFPIAGCSLAVSVAGGLIERKRPFSLLRLTGTPLAVLRRVVTLESAVPLLIAAAVSITTGFLAAALFLKSQLDYSLTPPGIEYYLIVVTGIIASLGIITSTLPLLSRITGSDSARND